MKTDVFHLGDVTFDTTKRTLTDKDGRPIQLRNKSKAVLVCLLKTPNCTVPKTEILDSVWTDVIVSDESLVQCIADIRRIIGLEARQILETVPREGYRMNPQARTAMPKRVSLFATITAVAFILAATWFFWQNGAEQSIPVENSVVTASATNPPGTDNVQAYLEVLKGRISSNRFSESESLIAERHFRKAIELDPNYARAYAELGTLLAVRFENDWTVIETADKEKALFYAEKAVSIDPDLWLAQYALGRLNSLFSNFDLAEKHLEQAMSLQPDNEDARAYYGIVKTFQLDFENAIAILEQAVKSHPHPPYWYYFGLGHAYFIADRFDKAESALNTCLELAEESPYCLRYLIAVHGETGNLAEAEAAGRRYVSMGFTLSIKDILTMVTYDHPDSIVQLEQALRQAGVPN